MDLPSPGETQQPPSSRNPVGGCLLSTGVQHFSPVVSQEDPLSCASITESLSHLAYSGWS